MHTIRECDTEDGFLAIGEHHHPVIRVLTQHILRFELCIQLESLAVIVA